MDDLAGDALHHAIMRAHAADDRAGLVQLYTRAATASDDINAKCFYLTYAYIYALELGHESAGRLQHELKQYGRE